MTQRKPLYIDPTEGYAQEMDPTSDTITLFGLTMGGNIVMGDNLITGLGTPANPGDAVSKAYADAIAIGLRDFKESARARTTDNIANLVDGAPSVLDGVTLAAGDRILVMAQSDAEENGIYVVDVLGTGADGEWSRSSDASTSAQVTSGMFLFVEEGTLWKTTAWVLSTPDPIVLGTTALTFTHFSSIADLVAGDGLAKTGNTLDVDLAANPGLQFTSNKLDLKLKSDLAKDADGLYVTGVPALFNIDGTATGATVTAPNLDTLTDGSNADLLHVHELDANNAKRVMNELVANEAIAVADPVSWSTTASKVAKSTATSVATSKVIGVALTAAAEADASLNVVHHGIAEGVLSGATPGAAYYLQAAGGIGTAVPEGNVRVIQVGVALSATDLWVRIVDYGRRIA